MINLTPFHPPEQNLNEFKGTVKTNPKHLPVAKRRELDRAIKTLRKNYPIEMIILYGSHARGDWQDDHHKEQGTDVSYVSDFDLLLVVETKALEKDIETDFELSRALHPSFHGTDVSLIVHNINYINQMLNERRFFFYDIYHEGYMLYDAQRFDLVEPPKELEPAVKLRQSTEYFDEWFESSEQYTTGFQMFFDLGDRYHKKAAFQLHQAAESFLHTFMLVYTGYRPKQHDLKKLLYFIAALDIRFRDTIPLSTDRERQLFDLLRRAYVESRYDRNYRVSQQDLLGMAAAVQRLRDTTNQTCRDHIAHLQTLINNT